MSWLEQRLTSPQQGGNFASRWPVDVNRWTATLPWLSRKSTILWPNFLIKITPLVLCLWSMLTNTQTKDKKAILRSTFARSILIRAEEVRANFSKALPQAVGNIFLKIKSLTVGSLSFSCLCPSRCHKLNEPWTTWVSPAHHSSLYFRHHLWVIFFFHHSTLNKSTSVLSYAFSKKKKKTLIQNSSLFSPLPTLYLSSCIKRNSWCQVNFLKWGH